MPAIYTSTVPTAVAEMLLRVHWFVADHTRRTFVLGKTVTHLQRWGPPGAGASISWLLKNTKAAILSLVRFTARLREVRTIV